MPTPREQFECPHCGSRVWLFEEAPVDTACPHCDMMLSGLSAIEPNQLPSSDLQSLVNALRVSLADLVPDPEILRLVPSSVVRELIVLPISRTGRTLKLAVTDSVDIETCDKLRFILNCDLEYVIAEESDIRAAIERYYAQ